MPKYDFRHPTLSSNVTLTYPTSSGTFALVGQGGFSLNNASGSRLIISDGTSTAATASSTLTYVSPYLTLSGSTSATGSSERFLNLQHNSTTAGTSASFGVGISFKGETASGTQNVEIGTLDYVWEKPNAQEWGKAVVYVNTSGSTQETKLISAGMEHSFGGIGQYTTINNQLSDRFGNYPNYRVYFYATTTTVTRKRVTFGDAAESDSLLVPQDTTWMFTAYIVARRTDADNESAAYWVQGAIDNNAGVVALVGAPQITALEDTVAWNVEISALGGALNISVIGEDTKTIRWNGYVDIVQVNG